ncbi:MAG: 1,4-alpha-glucan branching enzyme [Butyrivibrio sp.]|nr:1,4-alpha-glucan branching enzyme [Butyrivibrio sp.]
MNNKLYKLMNWPEIEEIIYSDGNDPHRILGAHKVGSSLLIQAFLPGTKQVTLQMGAGGRNRKNVVMEQADEAGFYAALVPYKEGLRYTYLVEKLDGEKEELEDPYRFAPLMTREDFIKLGSSIHYRIYEQFGAHPMTRDGVAGTEFAVWAPDAARVSVVGEFNDWDGRVHQMCRVDSGGVFELFLPGVGDGAHYQYEIKTRAGKILRRMDPYARALDPEDSSICIVRQELAHEWQDENFCRERKKFNRDEDALSICELSIESFAAAHEDGKADYRTLGKEIKHFAQEHGFRAVELHPVMEHIKGHPYHILAPFALQGDYGSAEEFCGLVEELHEAGIRLILDIVPTYFPAVEGGLAQFDGRPVYEYGDTRLGVRPGSSDLVYDYGRGPIVNYLMSYALYWIEKFHADGLRLPDISKILYLDYDRPDGSWIPNMYGGNENLEALDFVKHLNSIVHKRAPGVLTLTKESACWPQVTANLDEGGLGFDLKWNNGWTKDFLNYIRTDPLFRSGLHNELTLSLIYCYTERFALAFTHEDVGQGLRGLYELMPGDSAQKLAGVRLSVAYLMTHPGKKVLYMAPGTLPGDADVSMGNMIRALNELYLAQPALHVLDTSEAGFEWINSMAADECMLTFVRRGRKEKDMLLVVMNMAGVPRDFEIGVPADGRYEEIFNSDNEAYGGSGILNEGKLEADFREVDGRPYCIPVHIAATSMSIFSYTPYTVQEKKIRKIHEEEAIRKEKERDRERRKLQARHDREEEELIEQLRAKYERELAAQEEAIERKYQEQEAERIRQILAEKPAGRGGAKKVARKSDQ